MHPRVFISSVIDGFKEYREAAKNGILDVGGEPVFVEDYPALSISPRTACLDGVSSCDLFIIIIGTRGGWTAPSGKLVVEEEYEEARRCKLRILAFVQNTDRDEGATRLVAKISDFVNGVFRPTFVTAKELQSAVGEALGPIIDHYSNQEVDLHSINEKFENPYEIYNETSLRFAFGPERVEELIDPVYLESEELRHKLFEIGHSSQV
ncbi:MAG: DUF4062 domain-containing protein, partial [Deltaproteobacteria bacterium]|nr:DUF4062 domain-containing protein [Deltaproteobacteria bacterium]